MNATTTSRLQEAVESLTTHTHTCLIYSDRTEQFAAAIPYMKKGLNNNERCIYITDDNSVAVVKKDMKRQGIDFDEAVETGSLKMATKDQSYLKHGTFDPDAMLGLVKNSVADAEQKGFSSLRVTGEMTWALGPQVDDAKLLEYETKLNEFFPRHNCSAICQYNIKRFSAEIIRDILYTHPIAIVGGVFCKN
ncbi:MAG TPA: MEDS domain-containing protein, partial [Candidatus Saccharimonadales bacterium]|nr:MEDS domain-containing protein [Candidatus Saccharimonadales bacterium]